MRLLILTTLFPRVPGDKQGNFVLDQARALAAEGAEVEVLVASPWVPPGIRNRFEAKRPVNPGHYASEDIHISNAEYFSLPGFRLGSRAAALAKSGVLPAVRTMASQRKFDAVLAHGILMGHVAVAAARELNIPATVVLHGVETAPRFDDTETKRKQIAETLNAAAAVVLVGSPLREYLKRYTSRDEHVRVIGNGFTVYPDLVPSSKVPSTGRTRIAAVSNYEESKGFELLVQAAADEELRAKVELVLVGGGEGFGAVRSLAARLGIAQIVHCNGPLQHRETLSEVMASDIFCLPSWRESFGIMYVEAMALGKFAIGCKGQGPSDFMRHLDTGFLIQPQSQQAVVESLRWAIDHPAERKEIAARAKKQAFAELTWQHNAVRILELQRELLSNRSAQVGR